MNRRLKLITAILLTIAMAFTGTCVFAGTNAPSSGDKEQALVEVTAETAPDEAAVPEEDAQDITLELEKVRVDKSKMTYRGCSSYCVLSRINRMI